MTTLDTVLAYLRAVEAHAPIEEIEAFLHPEFEVTEHPNKITPTGKVYDRAALRAASERGRALMASERYAVRSTIVEGERAVVQLVWTGTLHDGRTMQAQICSVFALRDGKLHRQEQYDCFT